MVTGAPDGGDGGRGGDIHFKAQAQMYDLSVIRKPHIFGQKWKTRIETKMQMAGILDPI